MNDRLEQPEQLAISGEPQQPPTSPQPLPSQPGPPGTQMEDMTMHDTCAVCQDRLTHLPVATPCGHIFHMPCMQRWIEACRDGGRPCSCPVCRAQVPTARTHEAATESIILLSRNQASLPSVSGPPVAPPPMPLVSSHADMCHLCDGPLIGRLPVAAPCGHMMHASCLRFFCIALDYYTGPHRCPACLTDLLPTTAEAGPAPAPPTQTLAPSTSATRPASEHAAMARPLGEGQ